MALRDLATKDLGWKLFSLGLAMVIWFTVQAIRQEAIPPAGQLGTGETRTFSSLPVLVVSAAADVRAFGVNPSSVQVTVSGRPEVITGLQEKDMRVTVDLTGIEAAQDLRKRVEVSAPPGVTLDRVTPSEVDVVVPPKQANQ